MIPDYEPCTEVDNLFREKFKGSFTGFYVEFFDLVKGLAPAIYLTQCFYWQKKMVEANEDDDTWWYKSQEHWADDTRLSAYQQSTSRKRLRKMGLLEEKRLRKDGVLHFRLNVPLLRNLLETVVGVDSSKWRVDHGPDEVSSSPPSRNLMSHPHHQYLTQEEHLDPADAESLDSEEGPAANAAGVGEKKRENETKRQDKDSSRRDERPKRKKETEEPPQKGKGIPAKLPSELLLAASSGARTYKNGVPKTETVAQKAARLAQSAVRVQATNGAQSSRDGARSSSGGSRRRRPRKPQDPFDAALSGAVRSARRDDPVRKALSKRKAAPEPVTGDSFAAIEVWARERVKQPKKRGAGIKPPDEWVGRDLDQYLIDLVAKVLVDLEVPDSTGKTRGQAQNLITSVGSDRAHGLVTYCVRDWGRIKALLKLTSPGPTFGVLLAYLESVKHLKAGKTIVKGSPSRTGTNRGRTQAEYDTQPKTGWA